MQKNQKRSRGIMGRVGFGVLTVLLGLSVAAPALAWWGNWYGGDCNHDDTPPIPEPSSALMFAAGAFVISRQMARRSR